MSIRSYLLKSYVLTICVAAALAVAPACSKKGQGENTQAGMALPVKVQAAQSQQVGDYTEYISTIRSRSGSILQPDVEGQITRILVRSGDRVSAGQTLMEIDPRKQAATLNSQEATRRSRMAALDYNRRELARRQQLFSDGVISRQELDQQQQAYDSSKAEVDALEANVREQRVQLHYYSVKAPAAGVVGDIPVRVGDRVTVQTVLTTLDRGNDLEAYISIPAEKAKDVRVGTPVEILDDSDKPAVRTSIGFISPRLDTASQLLLLKANVPADKGFRNDQLVHVRIIWKEQERTTIPVTAVSRLGNKTFAFVAESKGNQSVARQKAVTLGDLAGNQYVVLDGLQPGEKLIVTGVQMLVDGMPVTPQS